MQFFKELLIVTLLSIVVSGAIHLFSMNEYLHSANVSDYQVQQTNQ